MINKIKDIFSQNLIKMLLIGILGINNLYANVSDKAITGLGNVKNIYSGISNKLFEGFFDNENLSKDKNGNIILDLKNNNIRKILSALSIGGKLPETNLKHIVWKEIFQKQIEFSETIELIMEEKIGNSTFTPDSNTQKINDLIKQLDNYSHSDLTNFNNFYGLLTTLLDLKKLSIDIASQLNDKEFQEVFNQKYSKAKIKVFKKETLIKNMIRDYKLLVNKINFFFEIMKNFGFENVFGSTVPNNFKRLMENFNEKYNQKILELIEGTTPTGNTKNVKEILGNSLY